MLLEKAVDSYAKIRQVFVLHEIETEELLLSLPFILVETAPATTLEEFEEKVRELFETLAEIATLVWKNEEARNYLRHGTG